MKASKIAVLLLLAVFVATFAWAQEETEIVEPVEGEGVPEEPKKPKTYEEAKKIAEEKLAELEELAGPLLALEKGDTSALPEDPKAMKELTGKAYAKKVEKKGVEVNDAITDVLKLVPSENKAILDDYQKWVAMTQGRRKRLGAYGGVEQSKSDEEAEAAAAAKTRKKKEQKTVFVLPDKGWRDPFLHPGEPTIDSGMDDKLDPDTDEELKKIWEDALASLSVAVIIGLDLEDELMAVVAGQRVRSGDTVLGDKLLFQVEEITKDMVVLRCITRQKQYADLKDQVTKRRIGL